ncbi:hypothetical protein HELRODRAFT_192116 [Helobdella robusta]|uniref:C-type lectin domain-containing protein n=1 Tax=Helobdella robusta TaxID=6412 RepID=T1FTL3_HELRO|nr:hypothetical protein HELRODRAFT_192116 [Helobdella robusta]ESO03116.1 hypothetical protein HELRODRAFT_192116 [Helobdella robusta]
MEKSMPLLLLISLYASADMLFERMIFVRVEKNSQQKFFSSNPDARNYFVSTKSFGAINFAYFAFPSKFELDLKDIKIFENLNREQKKICSLKCSLEENCTGFAYEDVDQDAAVGCSFIQEDHLANITSIHPDLERKTVFFRSEDYFEIYSKFPNQLPNTFPNPTAKLYMINEPGDWFKARAFCNEKFRGLTTLGGRGENTELKNFIILNAAKDCSDLFWTAGRRRMTDKSYLWHTAARKKRPPFESFTNWKNSSDGKGFGCITMGRPDGLWQARDCLEKLCYACEVL